MRSFRMTILTAVRYKESNVERGGGVHIIGRDSNAPSKDKYLAGLISGSSFPRLLGSLLAAGLLA